MLKDKVLFITGATRGIGREIALKCAADGAKIVVTDKTVEQHPTLPGTIYRVAKEIEAAGGRALPIQLDVRDDQQIQQAVLQAAAHFGVIDILINNASAISLTDTLNTTMKRYDLMMGINSRATFATSQACIPYLIKSTNPHILTLSPPLNMQARWFAPHLAYTMSKYGMSMCTLGLAEELKAQGIAVNSLWPKTTIATAAIAVNFPQEILQASRHPKIVADAAYWVVNQNSQKATGNFFVDEDVLRAQGVTDFSKYALSPEKPLYPDLFLN